MPTERQSKVPPDRIFSGIFPCGIVYADRYREKAGDYKRLAFLPYNTLKLEFEPDAPAHLREEIQKDVAKMNLKPGQNFRISTSGQYVVLGGGKTNTELDAICAGAEGQSLRP